MTVEIQYKPFDIPFTPASERVSLGVLLLDMKIPGWRSKIRQKLEMDSCFWCVLGQIFGMYSDGVNSLLEGSRKKSFCHGFLPLRTIDARNLEEEWKKEISRVQDDTGSPV